LGSPGARTFSAPPSADRANAAQPFNRTITQPGSPGLGAPVGGGFFNRPGMGMLGGLAAGFLGAGLLGMLFGGGMFGGLGGLSSIIGLMLQIGLIIVVRLAMSLVAAPSRNRLRLCGPARRARRFAEFPDRRNRLRTGIGQRAARSLTGDYEAFEQLLGRTQAAWSNEDVQLHALATPEMVSYRNLSSRTRLATSSTRFRRLFTRRPCGSLARRRDQLRQRGDAVLDRRQDRRSRHRPAGRRQRATGRSRRRCGPSSVHAAAAGTLGDPANLIAGKWKKQGKALRLTPPRRLFVGVAQAE